MSNELIINHNVIFLQFKHFIICMYLLEVDNILLYCYQNNINCQRVLRIIIDIRLSEPRDIFQYSYNLYFILNY